MRRDAVVHPQMLTPPTEGVVGPLVFARVKAYSAYQVGGEDVPGCFWYTLERLRQTEPGWGHLTAIGTDITAAKNVWEEISPSATEDDDYFGNGIRVDQLDPDDDDVDNFAIGPVPNGTPVLAWRLWCGNGETQWWFAALNAMPGSC
ncbi:MAG: hypothetical protein GX591_20560 [Planctomycetes bacterium]|nr:hypothetical protein [Planctomycetota bacterium]